ncbi:MAG TPA: DUF4331 domain-containing protein [Pyrinomonadaceae bacterium]|nr:DUF4331 domain-containing protein [Pyrinomonadaceae bacterium]
MRRLLRAAYVGLLVISMLTAGTFNTAVRASSHREAPSTSVDPMADGTDVYAFVDPNNPTRVNLIMNFIPFQLPQGGPNFYRFDDNIEYAMRVDNNGDAVTDIQYVFRFRTVVSNVNTFLYNTGPVTSLNDPDLNIKQFYSLSVVRGNAPNTSTTTLTPLAGAAAGSPAGFPFVVPPVNVGVRSTPNYEANLGQPAVTPVGTASGEALVFAGQREEGFFVDVGSAFDLFGLRPFNSAHLIPRTNTPGVDGTAGFNVSTIAIQVPIVSVTANGSIPTNVSDPNAVISVYSASSRTAMLAFAEDRSGRVTFSGNFVQVSRLGNPLVNEILIPLGMKDRFNASLPSMDAQFLNFILDPEPGRLFGYAGSPPAFDLYPTFNVPAPPRSDVANTFLTGIPGLNVQTNISGNPSVAAYANQPANTVPQERLRLNLAVPPTAGTASAAGTANRLGVLGGDNAGFPNGRRVGDDVVDIELRVLAGALVSGFNVAPNNQLGDGVNQNDVPFMTVFPYLATPRSGYDSPTSTAVGTTDTNAAAVATASPTPRP